MRKLADPRVESIFQSYPDIYRLPLMQIRELIFYTAESLSNVEPLLETLKWNQPSYVTHETKSGSTIRIDRFGQNKIAVFFHCKTTLVDTFKVMFPELEYSKNRAIILDPNFPLPLDELSLCFEIALTYHAAKKYT